jgi:transcriptional regulator with XRE-family HTH domain
VLRLKYLRCESGKPQYEVAALVGIHRPELSKMESGRVNPTADELARLARFYNVPAERLLDHIAVADGVEYQATQRERTK